MFKELENNIKNISKFVSDAEKNLDSEISKMSDKDKQIFLSLKDLAKQGKIAEIKDIINKCYK